MQVTRVYLVRHGETEWNNMRRYQGCSDIVLNINGRRQAELLQHRFREIPLEAAYASDLKRAQETAKTIIAPHGLKLNLDTGLRETNFGDWEGLNHQEIIAAFPKEWHEWRCDPGNRAVPGGESFKQVKNRVQATFNKIIEKEQGKNILLVAHGGSLRALICSVLGLKLNFIWRFRLNNTGVSVIDCIGENKILVLLNDICHLVSLNKPPKG